MGVSTNNKKENPDAGPNGNSVDSVPPWGSLFLLGIQHVLALYTGAIAVPILIGDVAGLSDHDVALLISADLLAGGIASIIQSAGIWKFGVRMPLMMGVTFAAVPSMIAMVSNPGIGLTGMFGAIIVAGVITMLLAPLVGHLVELFPPVVTGTVIVVIGIALAPVGINWMSSGGPGTAGDPLNLAIALIVLVTIALIMKFGRGFLRSIAVLLGILVGILLSAALGKVDFSGIGKMPWFELVAPFHFGLPEFHLAPIMALSVVMIVVMVETTGMMLTLGVMVEKELTSRDIVRGLRVDGLGTMIGGVFNTFPYVSFSQNIGLVGVTNVRSRWVCVMAGVIMVVLALFPRLSLVFALIPEFILGGAGIIMFGMVIATGVSMLSRVDFSSESGRNNLFIVAVSICIGMIPEINPSLLASMPGWIAPFTHSGIVLAALTAVALNLFFNGLPKRKTTRACQIAGKNNLP